MALFLPDSMDLNRSYLQGRQALHTASCTLCNLQEVLFE